MLSSGSGALGVSSAMAQPPGFTDSPEGTSPDQGRRKRRAKARAVLKCLLATRRGPRAPPVMFPHAVLVRLDDQPCGRLHLRHRCDFEAASEPSPPLTARCAACESGTIRQLTRSWQNEDLDPTPERTNLREDAIRLTAPPCNPMSTSTFDDPILVTVRRDSNSLSQRRNNLPGGSTCPLVDHFHCRLSSVIPQSVCA